MKIKVWDAIHDKDVLNGEYEYLEGGTTNGLPSFHIDFGYGHVYFYCEKKEELDELIESLQEIKNEIESPQKKSLK